VHGIKGGLEHAFKTKLTDQEVNDLMTFMEENIPDEKDAHEKAEGISG
jgi:hypothetical protein